MLQACREEMVMTAVNSIPFYFHNTDITFTLRHRQGFPCFNLVAVQGLPSYGLCSGIISIDSTC